MSIYKDYILPNCLALIYRYGLIIILIVQMISCGTTNKTRLDDKDLMRIDLMINEGRLEDADKKLETLMTIYPSNSEVLRRAGMVKYYLNDKQKAFKLLSRADSLSSSSNPDILFSIGVCAFEIGRLHESESYFKKFNSSKSNTDKIKKAEGYLKRINKVKEAMRDSSEIKIETIGTAVNTESDEFLAFPTLDNENLLFSRRFKSGNTITEKLMVAQKENKDAWTSIKEFEVEGLATGSLSGDGKTLVSTTCERFVSIGSCDLIITYKTEGKWSTPKNMSDFINSIDWDGQPCISADGNLIIFSSSRKGGFGGRDLYYTVKGANGWQVPVNLGNSINTEANEESPFLHPDKRTLYFRSNHDKGLGSYDIYMSRYNLITKKWEEPINLGYPVNTVADDGALTIGPDGITAYLTSDRGSLYSKKPHFDIYTFELPTKFQAIPTTYLKVRTLDSVTKKPIRSKVVIEESINSNIVFEGTLDQDGEITIPVNSKASYNILVTNDQYFPVSRQFSSGEKNISSQPMEIDVFLQKMNKETPMIFNNILFETGSAALQDENNIDLEYLLKLMKENPSMKIKIVGHTDNTGSSAFNQTLSEKRAKAVASYLINNGINNTRIVTEGQGDKKPLADNKTEEGRKINRRTEVFIL